MFFGIVLRGTPARLGEISTQPIVSQELPSYQDVLQQTVPTTGPLQQESNVVRSIEGNSVELFNPSRIFVPQTSIRIPIVLPPLPPSPPRVVSEETLNLTEIEADGEVSVNLSGLSPFRPEIVSVTEYHPTLDAGGRITTHGKNLDLMQNLEGLRRGNFLSLIGSATIAKVAEEFQAVVSEQLAETEVLASGLKRLDQIEGVLDVSSNTSFSRFFQEAMYYGANSFSVFSNTKILMQMAQDLRSILETSTLNLVPSSIDPSRGEFANDSIRLDKTWRDSFTFTFTSQLLSGTLPFQETIFQRFKQSLPGNSADRIRVIANCISKELKVSRGLSKRSVQTRLGEYYRGSTEGNPFDNIFGEFGESILEAPRGTNSIGSILYLPRETFVLLPFEKKFVESRQTAFVPGSRAFLNFDSATRVIDLAELRGFTQKASEVVGEASTMCRELLEPDVSTDSSAYLFQGSQLFRRALSSILSSFNDLSLIQAASRQGRGQEEQTRTSVEIYTSLAILHASARDQHLNFLLFQLLVLVAISKLDTVTSRLLTTELGSVSNLASIVTSNSDSSIFGEVTPETTNSAIQLLARRIESRIKQVTPGAPGGQEIRPTTSSNYQDNIAVPNQFIAEILSGLVSTTINTPLKATVDLLQQLIVAGNTGDLQPFLANGSTRFNQIAISGMLMLCFELFQTMIDHLFDISFYKEGPNLTISTFPENTLGADAGARIALQGSNPDFSQFSNDQRRIEYQSARNFSRGFCTQTIALLDAEDSVVFRAMEILTNLVSNLNTAKNNAVIFFSDPPTTFVRNSQIAKNRVQILGSKALLTGYQTGISLSEWYSKFYTMKEMLKTPMFAAGNRIKLFSIGIPENFTAKLASVVSSDSPRSLRERQQEDVVVVKVYKRSSEDDELVWKPKSFLFDLSVFPGGAGAYRTTTGDFTNRLRQITVLDGSNNFQVVEKDKLLMVNDASRALTSEQQNELFLNHVRSDLLQLYIQLASGLDLSEFSFQTQLRQRVSTTEVLAQTLSDMLDNAVDKEIVTRQEVEAVRELMQTLSTVSGDKVQELFSTIAASEVGITDFLRTDCFNARKFDRVFCLPVDIDDFELDLGDVSTPRSVIIAQQTLTGQLRRGGDGERIYQNRKNEPNALIFDQFFVTVEPVSAANRVVS
jgi:hypothetical protein